jgi:hypothetical protein
MGAKKKLVARILKSEPLILKSKPLIFCPVKTRLKTGAKTQINSDTCFFVFMTALFYKYFGKPVALF